MAGLSDWNPDKYSSPQAQQKIESGETPPDLWWQNPDPIWNPSEAQFNKMKKNKQRLQERTLSRSKIASTPTPNVLGGGVRGRPSSDRRTLLNPSNELSSLLEV